MESGATGIGPCRELELFIEDQAFSPSYDWLPSPPPFSKLVDRRHTGKRRKRDNLLTGEGGEGGKRSQIIRRQESLVRYESFNTLCLVYNTFDWFRLQNYKLPISYTGLYSNPQFLVDKDLHITSQALIWVNRALNNCSSFPKRLNYALLRIKADFLLIQNALPIWKMFGLFSAQ
jgi:hypothetical protein